MIFGVFHYERILPEIELEYFTTADEIFDSVIKNTDENKNNLINEVISSDYTERASDMIRKINNLKFNNSKLGNYIHNKESLLSFFKSFQMTKDLFEIFNFNLMSIANVHCVFDCIIFDFDNIALADALYGGYIAPGYTFKFNDYFYGTTYSNKYNEYVDSFASSVSLYNLLRSNSELISLEVKKKKYRNTVNELDRTKVNKYILKFLSDSGISSGDSKRYKYCHSIFDYINSSMISQKNCMSNYEIGVMFEDYVKRIYLSLAFKVLSTPESGDFGIDLVAEDSRDKIGIQCKNYSGNVGVDAVMQCFSGAKYYGCNRALLICTTEFTESAIEMARKIGVELKTIEIS
jgi:hypothetical protein